MLISIKVYFTFTLYMYIYLVTEMCCLCMARVQGLLTSHVLPRREQLVQLGRRVKVVEVSSSVKHDLLIGSSLRTLPHLPLLPLPLYKTLTIVC